jgi:hypothetical protein
VRIRGRECIFDKLKADCPAIISGLIDENWDTRRLRAEVWEYLSFPRLSRKM